jgi:hypothetical protein
MKRLHAIIYTLARRFALEDLMLYHGRKAGLTVLEISADLAAAEGRKPWDDHG